MTVPSIVRQAQYENLKALMDQVQSDENFIRKWSEVEKEHIERNRKKYNRLIELDKPDEMLFDSAA